MNIKKYKVPIIVYAAYNVFLIILVMFANYALSTMSGVPWPLLGLTYLIPVNDMIIQILIIFILILPISSILGVFGGYIIVPIIIYLHKKILGKKYDYYIQDKPISNKFQNMTRAFVPVLLAMNFGFLLSIPQIQTIILRPEWINLGSSAMGPLTSILTVIILLIFTYGISIFILSGTWFLLDSGIVYSTKKAVEKKEEPYEILSLGGWINRLLKGYAGVTVLITYFTITINFLSLMIFMGPVGIINLIFYPLLPFLLMLPAIPGLIYADIIIERRRKFVRNMAKKFGITEITQE